MRPSLWLSLVSLCLSVVALKASFCAAQGVKNKGPAFRVDVHGKKNQPPTRENPRWEVKGYGKDEAGARQDAFEEAAKVIVKEWMAPRGIQWTAKPEVLRDYLRQWNLVTPKGPAEDKELEDGERVKVATATVELWPKNVRELDRLARQGVMQERQGVLVRVLIGLVVLLTLVTGYFRLEEATRGFYTGLLRVAVVGILALAVFGLWVVG